MKRIAIFASGSGTNMQRIAEWFATSNEVEISLVVCNKPGAGVIARAQKFNIPVELITRDQFYHSDILAVKLQTLRIDLIVLAGFLWLVPDSLLHAFPGKIINIHPALLPAYGGKGMYGSKVHEAVVAAGEKYSGITIHYVNEHYDEGAVIFQQNIELAEDETPDSLAARIHELEYKHFPEVIAALLNN